MKKTSNGIQLNNNLNICPNKYKTAIDTWAKDEKVKYKKSLKKMRKMRKFNMWFGWIMGSVIIGWETTQVVENIINFDGWKSVLFIGLYLSLITLWTMIIYGSFKTRDKIKLISIKIEERKVEIVEAVFRGAKITDLKIKKIGEEIVQLEADKKELSKQH